MDVNLLSGVVRNRKVNARNLGLEPSMFEEHAIASQMAPRSIPQTIWDALCGKFFLRAHKFTFEWEFAVHVILCMVSLAPFVFSGDPRWAALPLSVWAFYNST